MRCSVLLMVAAAAFVALAMVQASDSSANDGEIYVVDNGLRYQIMLEAGEAMLIGSDTGVSENVVVPATVDYQGNPFDVNVIDDFAFFKEGIRTVTFDGQRIERVGKFAFDAMSIESINVENDHPADPADNTRYMDVDGILFMRNRLVSDNELTLVRYPASHPGTSYNISASVVELDTGVFENCTVIEEITFDPDIRVPIIPQYAFHGCTSLQRIGYDGEFNTLPSSVISIEDIAFESCSSLLNMRTPDNLRSIMAFAFDGSGISRVALNSDLSFISDYAFSDCRNLSGFELDIDPTEQTGGYYADSGILYKTESSTTRLICYPAGRTDGSFIIPDNVASISDGSFCGCRYLRSVTLNSRMFYVPWSAFNSCAALETVTFSKSITIIEDTAFYGCTSLTSVSGWDNVTSIGYDAFSRCGFTSLTLPSSIRTVLAYAFADSALTEVTVPDTEVTLEVGVFSGCAGLKKITFEGGDMVLEEGALNVGTSGTGRLTVEVYVNNGVSVPSEAVSDEYTDMIVNEEGKHPYPYENLIGVFVCILILLGIFRIIKEV